MIVIYAVPHGSNAYSLFIVLYMQIDDSLSFLFLMDMRAGFRVWLLGILMFYEYDVLNILVPLFMFFLSENVWIFRWTRDTLFVSGEILIARFFWLLAKITAMRFIM